MQYKWSEAVVILILLVGMAIAEDYAFQPIGGAGISGGGASSYVPPPQAPQAVYDTGQSASQGYVPSVPTISRSVPNTGGAGISGGGAPVQYAQSGGTYISGGGISQGSSSAPANACAPRGRCDACQAIPGCYWNGIACIPGTTSFSCTPYIPRAAVQQATQQGGYNEQIVQYLQQADRICGRYKGCVDCTQSPVGCEWAPEIDTCTSAGMAEARNLRTISSIDVCYNIQGSSKKTIAAEGINFELDMEPETISVAPGETASYILVVHVPKGTNAQMSVGIKGLPAGAKASYSQKTGQVKVLVSTTEDTPVGIHNFQVLASDGVTVKQVVVPLVVKKSSAITGMIIAFISGFIP